MQDIFVTSDHHFGHREIIDYESRPFADAGEMDAVMIQRWNEAVSAGDTVYHLGDFSFGGLSRTREVVGALNGYKHLILGNHDRDRSRQWWLEAGFDEVHEQPIVYRGFYFLSHEPMYMNRSMPYLNVHGHIHGQKYAGRSYFNVSVEHWEYRPVSFAQVLEFVSSGEEQPT
ncbi:metallophosphoesterase [Paenibacillus sp. D51F]